MNDTEKAYYDLGYNDIDGMKHINFWHALGAVVRWSYMRFPEYVPDPNREYVQGEAFRVGYNKYVTHNWGKISGDPSASSLCKLVRDVNSHDPDGAPRIWIKEEYCIKGTKRYHIDKWYIVKTPVADSATPPPNDTAAWGAAP